MTVGSLRTSELSLDAIDALPLRQVYAFWREVSGNRPWVLASELRPERFPAALQHIAIVERVLAPRAGLRIRLCGADIENRDFGIYRGAFVEDARPDWYRDHVVAEIGGAMAEAVPRLRLVQAVIDCDTFSFTRLILPLSTDGGVCDQLIVATVRPSNQIVDAMRVRLALA